MGWVRDSRGPVGGGGLRLTGISWYLYASIMKRKVTLMSKSSAHVWAVQPERCSNPWIYEFTHPLKLRQMACWSINKPPAPPSPAWLAVLIAKLCNHDVWATHTRTHRSWPRSRFVLWHLCKSWRRASCEKLLLGSSSSPYRTPRALPR